MSDWYRAPNRLNPRRTRAFGVDTTPVVSAISPNSSRIAGGGTVTITGRRFITPDGSVPIVTIGGIAATGVVVVSDTTITAVVPSATAPAIVDVSVTWTSQTGTLASAFTYYAVTILLLDPAFGPLAGGTEVTIRGANFDTAASYDVQFGGISATGVGVVDSQTILATTPSHAVGYVDVVIFDGVVEQARLRGGFTFTLLTRGNDIRRQPGISVRDVLNNAPNEASFTVDGESNTPVVGEKIEITDAFDGNRRLFAGNVQSLDQVYEGQTDQLAWPTKAIDFTWLANKYRPFGKYVKVSVSDVVKDLVTKFVPGFTTNHVQTKLAKVSVTYDGSKDLSTCLNELGQTIGGGHWYWDYDQDLHFFHNLPAGLIIPQLASPITAMVVTEGAGIPSTFSFPAGFYLFRSSNVFDNGVESALGPYSNCVALQGTNQISFGSVPIGSAVGAHAVVARRIYATYIGPGVITSLAPFCEVGDNATATFTTWFGATGASVAPVTAIAATVSLPLVPATTAPAGPAGVMSAAQSVSPTYVPQFPPFGSTSNQIASATRGLWAFKASCIYRDGSESLPSAASNSVYLNEFVPSAQLNGVPVGPTIDGNDVVARKIFACYGVAHPHDLAFVVAELQASKDRGALDADWGNIIGHADAQYLSTVPIPTNYFDLAMIIGFGDLDYLLTTYDEPDWSPERTSMWYLLNDNTTASADVGPGMGAGVPSGGGGLDDIPTWPNADGPSLEDVDPPDDIDDANTDLLHGDSGSQLFTVTTDQSQIRNRVYVVGRGSSLLVKALSGDTQLRVADPLLYAASGGSVIVDGRRLAYFGTVPASAGGILSLKAALTADIEQGLPVNLFYQADDLASQRDRAKVELDTNGRPTDGVHEYTIVDGSLATPFQLYMRAFAELELFAWPIRTIKYATRGRTHSGQIVHVDLTNPPCQGDFLVQDVGIDQIHDESDQLLPRYTVTASSVKFELSDLLLALAGGGDPTSGLSGLASGVMDFATSEVVTAIEDTMVQNAGRRTCIMAAIFNAAIRNTIGVAPTEASPVAASFTSDARANWRKLNTSASSASTTAEVRWAAMGVYDHLPTERMRFRIESLATDIRMFLSNCSGGNPQNLDTQTSPGVIHFGLCFSSTRLDAGWRPYTWDGVDQVLYPAILTVDPNTEYLVEIGVTSLDAVSGGSVTITLQSWFNGAKRSVSTSIPISAAFAGNTCGPSIDLYTTENVGKSFSWAQVYFETGTF